MLFPPFLTWRQYPAGGRRLQSPEVMIEGGELPHLERGYYFSWNRTVTVKTTGRGLPLMIIGS
jgi:hypothetical protein